jgi:hypothetical protein
MILLIHISWRIGAGRVAPEGATALRAVGGNVAERGYQRRHTWQGSHPFRMVRVPGRAPIRIDDRIDANQR